MANESRNPLDFDAVSRQFADSVKSLANVREQLRVLTELRETEDRASAGLADAAEKVAHFSAEAATAVEGLKHAQRTTVEVLKSGVDLLDGTDLKGIAETVKANADAISAVQAQVGEVDSRVAELIRAVEALQSSLRQDVDALKLELGEIKRESRAPKKVRGLFRSSPIVDA